MTEGDAGDTTTATGTLAIVDSDSAVAPSFADVASITGGNGYGTFVLSSGVWTYTLDQAKVQDLDAGDTVTDTFTLTATGGTPQAVTVTIIGNDTIRIFRKTS